MAFTSSASVCAASALQQGKHKSKLRRACRHHMTNKLWNAACDSGRLQAQRLRLLLLCPSPPPPNSLNSFPHNRPLSSGTHSTAWQQEREAKLMQAQCLQAQQCKQHQCKLTCNTVFETQRQRYDVRIATRHCYSPSGVLSACLPTQTGQAKRGMGSKEGQRKE